MNGKAFIQERVVHISAGKVTLDGNLAIPQGSSGIVLFAHGSGSSRFSPRNIYVAEVLHKSGIATLLMDLLTPDEGAEDDITRKMRFDIPFLAERLVGATDWLSHHQDTQKLRVGYFGASTGAAAALVAAAERPDIIKAIVSRGGRPDLAGPGLSKVKAPTLLIVGGRDAVVIDLNRSSLNKLNAEKELVIVPGATHLFEESGTLEQVARHAVKWFARYL